MDRERVRQLQAALVAARDMRHVELRKEAPRDVVLDTIKDDINGLQAELQLYLPHPGEYHINICLCVTCELLLLHSGMAG